MKCHPHTCSLNIQTKKSIFSLLIDVIHSKVFFCLISFARCWIVNTWTLIYFHLSTSSVRILDFTFVFSIVDHNEYAFHRLLDWIWNSSLRWFRHRVFISLEWLTKYWHNAEIFGFYVCVWFFYFVKLVSCVWIWFLFLCFFLSAKCFT